MVEIRPRRFLFNFRDFRGDFSASLAPQPRPRAASRSAALPPASAATVPKVRRRRPLSSTPRADRLTLTLTGVIGRSGGIKFEAVRDALLEAPGKPILVRLDSPGGSLDEARRLYRLMRAASTRRHIETRVVGECSSAAILILAAADYRTAAPTARFMIHSAATAGGSPERWNARGHREQARWIEQANQALLDILAERLSAPRGWLQSWLESEAVISAIDAKQRFLIVDEIIPEGAVEW